MSRPALARRGARPGRQAGQALVEGVLAIPLLIGLWLGVAHVGNLLHAANRAADLGRLHAFLAAARVDPLRPEAIAAGIASSNEAVSLRRAAARQDAGHVAFAGDTGALRREWLAHDPGLLHARARAVTRAPVRLGPAMAMPSSALARYTVIATGAAHSSGDAQAQDRIARSATGWGNAADLSRRHGQRIANVMSRVDRPWRRPAPDFDWLRPWQGVVPASLLHRPVRSLQR